MIIIIILKLFKHYSGNLINNLLKYILLFEMILRNNFFVLILIITTNFNLQRKMIINLLSNYSNFNK